MEKIAARFRALREDLSEDEEVAEEDTESHSDEEDTPGRFITSRTDTQVTLEKNCFTLVVVGGRDTSLCGGCRALLCVILNSSLQVAVITVVGFNSPEYYFGNGVWLQPMPGMGYTIIAVKLCAVVLTFFQVIQEMQDVSQIFRVLTHYPRLEIKPRHRTQCFFATLVQYLFALAVMLVALQLVLSRQRPMDCLWINFYVFMTLGFDNMLCRFLLFCGSYCGVERVLDWTFELKASRTREERRLNRWYTRFNFCLFLLFPLVLMVWIVGLAMYCNLCPLTALRYGAVSNLDPVLMISPNLGVPESCCQVATSWSVNGSMARHTIPVSASVPCLASKHPEDDKSQRPVLYWVLWPGRKTPPNSLQIMSGRGGDSNMALQWGSVNAESYQMRVWLTKHDYDVKKVYRHLISEQEGIALYRSSFTYVAEWNITNVPWVELTRIYVTAYNPETGALSPEPVSSEVLLRELCAPHCRHCNEDGKCVICESGFTLSAGECAPCADNCLHCHEEGPHSCDIGECVKGYGIAKGRLPSSSDIKKLCFPCGGGAENCTSCDTPGTFGEGGGRERPCQVCRETFRPANGTCVHCPVDNCERCSADSECDNCKAGYVLNNKWKLSLSPSLSMLASRQCLACSDNCTSCDEAGAGRCDAASCKPGFTHVGPSSNRSCQPCAAHCKECNISGAGSCNEDQCNVGFARTPPKGGALLPWRQEPKSASCEACSSHCDSCTVPGECDSGFCEDGFGLQGGKQCSECAEDNCLRCEASWTQCDECAAGFGFSSLKTCQKCPENCRNCTVMDRCAQCLEGYRLDAEGQCAACADQCRSCDESGVGLCDPHQCVDGWTTTPKAASSKDEDARGNSSSKDSICRMCSDPDNPDCKRCDIHGPTKCDGPTQ